MSTAPAHWDLHRCNWKTGAAGVQWFCRGNHHRSADCEWELATGNLETMKSIDLYDMPIDLQPVPKDLTPEQVRREVIQDCIKTLQQNCDYFGVSLLRDLLG